jgi:hypothetical protein
MNRNRLAVVALAALVVACASGPLTPTAMAHEKDAQHGTVTAVHGGSPPPQEVTLRGELIDPQCYFTHASRGPEHASCARMCAQGGQDLAFLHEATGAVYPIVATGHGKNPNEGMLDAIGKAVQVKGTIYRMGKNAVLVVKSVTPVQG